MLFAKRQTAGIKFTQAKNQHFRPAGVTRCTDSCEIWHGRGDSGRTIFCANRCTGMGTRPPKVENFHILVQSPPGANHLTDFYSCWGLLYAQLSCISVLHLKRFT